MNVIILNFTNKSKYLYTKAEKILSYRKKYSAVRHEYFVMAQKYMSYNKVLLTFTVPTDIKEKSIKNGRYTKLRKLIKIRAYIAKLLNNSSDVKYFMNIELGEHYSNPHLHLQLWVKSPTSMSVTSNTTSSIITNIYKKTISKFDLNKNRCYITEPTHAIPIYNYVIKDYAKDLTDKQIWDLETQKKRFRKIMDSKVRFYSKSKDDYCKSIYRKIWYGLGIARDKANEFLDFFINKFFFFNKRNLPKIQQFINNFSKLGYMYITYTRTRTRRLNVFYGMFLFIPIYVFAPTLDPPSLVFLLISLKKIKIKGKIMTTEDMKDGIDFLNKIYDEDGEDVKIINKLFGHLKIGDIGTFKMILKSELEHCKKLYSENELQMQEHINSLSLVNKFCIIPYPDDIEHEQDEDYLIFLRYQLDGTRGEVKNVVFDMKYFLEMSKKGFVIEFVLAD